MVLLMERIDIILPLSVNFVAILSLIRVVMADYSLPGHLQLCPEVRDLIHRLLQKNPADRMKQDRIMQ